MRTVTEIQMEIQTLQNEIAMIQMECLHPTSTIVAYSWRVGAMNPARLCDTCQKNLNSITKEEEEKWWADWRKDNPLPTAGSTVSSTSFTPSVG